MVDGEPAVRRARRAGALPPRDRRGRGLVRRDSVVETPPGLWARWPNRRWPNCNAGKPANLRRLHRRLPHAADAGPHPDRGRRATRRRRTSCRGSRCGSRTTLLPQPALARLAGATVTLAFLVLAALLLFTTAAPLLSLVGLVVAVTPLAIFVGASISNSNLEIGAGIAFAAALLRLTRSAERPRWVWAAAVVSAAALVSSRDDGRALDLPRPGARRGAALGGAHAYPVAQLRRPLALLAGVAARGRRANSDLGGRVRLDAHPAGRSRLLGRGRADRSTASSRSDACSTSRSASSGGWTRRCRTRRTPPGRRCSWRCDARSLVSTRRERLVLAGTIAGVPGRGRAPVRVARGGDRHGRPGPPRPRVLGRRTAPRRRAAAAAPRAGCERHLPLRARRRASSSAPPCCTWSDSPQTPTERQSARTGR